MSTSSPGSPAHPHLGGNYAQPSASIHAVPNGSTVDRLTNWSGRKYTGAPYHTLTADAKTRMDGDLERLTVELSTLIFANVGRAEKGSEFVRQIEQQRLALIEQIRDE